MLTHVSLFLPSFSPASVDAAGLCGTLSSHAHASTPSRVRNSCNAHQVIEWCDHHKKDPEPIPEDADDTRKKTTEISEWDRKFIEVDQEMLFEIILAANYLDIKPLLYV
jgi:hypothetical protein